MILSKELLNTRKGHTNYETYYEGHKHGAGNHV